MNQVATADQRPRLEVLTDEAHTALLRVQNDTRDFASLRAAHNGEIEHSLAVLGSDGLPIADVVVVMDPAVQADVIGRMMSAKGKAVIESWQALKVIVDQGVDCCDAAQAQTQAPAPA